MMGGAAVREEVMSLCSQISGKKAIIIEDLHTGEYMEINREELFPAASLIKLPILYMIFLLSESKQMNLEERLILTKECRVGGFGVLKDLDQGLNPTIRDLATLMITVSDNTAANLLIDKIGITEINSGLHRIGMRDTVLHRRMMDEDAKARGLDNYTSAKDIQKVIKAIAEYSRKEEMMDILFRQKCNNKLPLLMGEEAKIAHKTGDLPGIEHDAGIIYLNGKEILAVVLTKELADNQEGVWLNCEIGKLIYTLAGTP